MGKIAILSTHYLLCKEFAAACRKIATFCPAYFSDPWRRCQAFYSDLVCM